MSGVNDQGSPEIGEFTQPTENAAPAAPLIPPTGEAQAAVASFIRGEAGSMAPTAAAKPTGEKKEDEPINPETREDELEEAINQIATNKTLTYDERLEKHNLTKDEAMHIVADMFDKGWHERSYSVVGEHVKVTLRTRENHDQVRLLERIESEAPQYPATVSSIVSRLNLTVSMVEFKGEDFREADFKDRYKFVLGLPDIVFRVLVTKLTAFDNMILDVMDEGAIENF